MSENLRKCPFCGATDKTGLLNICVSPAKDVYENEMIDFYTVKCHGCGTTIGRYYTKEEAAQRWNRRADGWISVEERPPEIGTLVIDSLGQIEICQSLGTFNLASGKTVYCNYNISELFAALEIESIKSVEDLTHITHWMSLPEPPEVVNESQN